MKNLILTVLAVLHVNTIQLAQASEYFIDIPTKSSGNFQALINISSQLPSSAKIKTELVEISDNGQLVDSYCETSANFTNALTGFLTITKNGAPLYTNDFAWNLSYQARTVPTNEPCQSAAIPKQAALNVSGRQMYTSVLIEPRIEGKKVLNLDFYAPSIKNIGDLKTTSNQNLTLTKLVNSESLQPGSSTVNFTITQINNQSTHFIESGKAIIQKCIREGTSQALCSAFNDTAECHYRCIPKSNSLGCYSCDWE